MILDFGSINMDLVVPVASLPRPGETVLCEGYVTKPGGKGANQAVAAARLGRRTAMVGRVGDDDAGRRLLAGLADAGVDATHVRATAGTASGIALIAVDGAGENAIVVSPGANGRLDAADVVAAQATVSAAAVVLLQLEVPVAAVLAAAEAARGTVVLNPAPALPLPDALLARVDVLVPNRSELGVLCAAPPPADAHLALAMAQQLASGRGVVVTLGADGAIVVAPGGHAERIAAPVVEAVDATGAGDCFCGALGDALAGGAELVEAARWAVRAAAASVTRRGAQAGMPTRAEVEAVPS